MCEFIARIAVMYLEDEIDLPIGAFFQGHVSGYATARHYVELEAGQTYLFQATADFSDSQIDGKLLAASVALRDLETEQEQTLVSHPYRYSNVRVPEDTKGALLFETIETSGRYAFDVSSTTLFATKGIVVVSSGEYIARVLPVDAAPSLSGALSLRDGASTGPLLPGDRIDVVVELTNKGVVAAEDVRIDIVLSRDGQVDASDRLVDSFTMDVPVPDPAVSQRPSATTLALPNLRLPLDADPGDRLLMIVDPRGAVPDLHESLFPDYVEELRLAELDAAPLEILPVADRTTLTRGDDVFAGGAEGSMIDGEAGDDSIAAGDGDDRIFGGSGSDEILGEGGRDVLLGEGDGDRLFGGAGADALDGGAGLDLLHGGAGSDRFSFSEDGRVDQILDWEAGIDRIDLRGFAISGADGLEAVGFEDLSFTQEARWMLISFESEAGTRALRVAERYRDDFTADSFVFRGGDLTPLALPAQTAIEGTGGIDTLTGTKGDDVLLGRGHTDFLYGGEGADRLDGGHGRDLLFGGAGADVFVFARDAGVDQFRDFEDGTDRIDVSLLGATALSEFTTAEEGAWTRLTHDASGRAVLVAGVRPDDLDAADFIFA